jgi:quinol monooxygenase YgiN
MFARIVQMDLKSGKGQEFTKAIDNEIIPTLRKFTGFVGEIAMVSTEGKEAIGISLWEHKEHAESYDRKGFAGVLKALDECVEGKAKVHTYEVTNSTLEALPVRKAA